MTLGGVLVERWSEGSSDSDLKIPVNNNLVRSACGIVYLVNLPKLLVLPINSTNSL